MSRFVKDTTLNLGGQVASMVFGLANGVILARVLGTDGRGILAGAMLIPQLLNALMASGFGTSIVYFVSSKKWNDMEALPRVVGLTLYIVAVVLVTGAASVWLGAGWLEDIPLAMLFVGLAVIPLLLATQSLSCLLQGKQAFRSLFRYRFIAAVVMIVATVAGLVLSGGVPMGALLGRIVGMGLGVVCLVLFVRGHYRSSSWKPDLDVSALKPALSYGGRAHAANAVSYLNYRADQFLVAGMIDASALGVYTVAVTWAEMLWLVAGNTSGVLLPRLASEKDSTRSVEITSQLARVMLVFILITTVCFGAVAVPVIPLLYKKEFAGAVAAFLALLPGIMAMGYTKVLANYMAAIGKPEINARNATVGLVVNLIANVILIRMWGIVGASLATSLSYMTICCLCYREYIRITKSPWLTPIVIQRDDMTKAVAMIRSVANPLLQKFRGK